MQLLELLTKDIVIRSEDEPQIKLYFKRLVEGFSFYSKSTGLDDITAKRIFEFLLERSKECALKIKQLENRYHFSFTGKDKQDLYRELGIVLAKTYSEFPGMITAKLFSKLEVEIMTPKQFNIDIISALNDLRVPVFDGTKSIIRYCSFQLFAKEDHAILGVAIRIGFEAGYMAKYTK